MHTLQGPLYFYSCKCTPFCSCKCTLCRHRFTFAVANAHSAGTALLLQLQIHTLQGPVYFAAANARFAGTALLCSCKCTLCRDSFTFAAANTHFAGTALLCSSKYTFCRDSFTLQLQIHTLQDSFTFQLQMHTLQDSFILQLQKGGGSFAAAKSTFDQQTRLPHIFAATGTCSCKKCDFGSGTTGHCFSSKTCSKFAAVKARGLRSLHSAICVCRI